MAEAVHSVSVAGVIVDDQDRVLVIRRRDNGNWEPPGGVLETGESIQDGLRREIREETGLDIEIGRLSGVYKNMSRAIIALVFRCRAIGGSPTPNAEVTDLRWMQLDEVQRELTEAYSIRVLDAIADDRAAVRSHDGTNLI